MVIKGTVRCRLLKTHSAQLGSAVTTECTHEEFCDVILTRCDCNIFELISMQGNSHYMRGRRHETPMCFDHYSSVPVKDEI